MAVAMSRQPKPVSAERLATTQSLLLQTAETRAWLGRLAASTSPKDRRDAKRMEGWMQRLERRAVRFWLKARRRCTCWPRPSVGDLMAEPSHREAIVDLGAPQAKPRGTGAKVLLNQPAPHGVWRWRAFFLDDTGPFSANPHPPRPSP